MEIAANQPPKTYRRHSDRLMSRRMIIAATSSAIINIIAYYLIIHTHFILWLFPLQALDPHAAEDNIVLVLCIAMATIIFLLFLYTMKVRGLLNDIRSLTEERERNREAKDRQRKLEALGQLSAGVSHEINTCLQTILGSCEIALHRQDNPSECALFIQRAIDNSLHARRVVNNVLMFANSGDSRNLEVFPLQEAIKRSISYSKAFLSKQVEVRIEHEVEQDVGVLMDSVGLAQSISNLVNNAAQAMEHKGVINITTGVVPVMDAVEGQVVEIPHGNYAFVKVRDSGQGISPETIGRIFDPFFTTRPIGEGTGLGLSMVHGLVQSMNGYVAVESTVGVGTVFTLYFPLSVNEDVK